MPNLKICLFFSLKISQHTRYWPKAEISYFLLTPLSQQRTKTEKQFKEKVLDSLVRNTRKYSFTFSLPICNVSSSISFFEKGDYKSLFMCENKKIHQISVNNLL